MKTDVIGRKLISISVTVFNEEENIDRLYERVCAVGAQLADRYDIELVFTDNRSNDDTWKLITDLARRDPRVRGYRFSRNFGFQNSILTNYMNTRGHAVMQLDADLQDPPELLSEFLEKWEQGYKVVYGVRRQRIESWALRSFRRFGYWFIDRLAGYSIPKSAGDFRLIDRSVVKALAKYNDQSPFLRGTIASLGFRQTGIEYDRDQREAGESKFPLGALMALGFDGLFSSSTVPLRMATFVGIAAILMSLFGTVYYIGLRYLNPDLPIGLASTTILILFSIGLNSLFLGIIGEYVIRIHRNLRGGDLAVIDEIVDYSQPAQASQDEVLADRSAE